MITISGGTPNRTGSIEQPNPASTTPPAIAFRNDRREIMRDILSVP